MATLKLLLRDGEIERIASSEETPESPDKKKRKVRPSSSTGDANTSRRITRSSKAQVSHDDDDDDNSSKDVNKPDLPPPISLSVGDKGRTGITLPFSKLRAKHHYIDKTELIADLHCEEAKGLYLCYPRQTGKSTVVDSFIQWSQYQPETREERKSLFENTKIMTLANEKMRDDTSSTTAKDQDTSTSAKDPSSVPLKDGIYGFNQHMILFADFGCIQANNIEEVKREVIKEFLNSLRELYSIKLPSMSEEEFLKKNPTSVSFFYDLLRLVEENNFAAETAVVVIDNFDAPVLRELNRTRSTPAAKALMDFFNQMLHIVELKPSFKPRGIIKIILTGSHYPVGMRAAHLVRFRIDVYPYTNYGYCKKFFFNAKEVQTLINLFKETVTLEKLSDLFGNYFIRGENYYHPGCVVNYFQRLKDDDSPDVDPMYWCTTDSLDILTTASGIEKYEMLLWPLRLEQTISFRHQEVLMFDKIMDDENHAFTYLLQAGYLAVVQPRTHPVTYKIPNAEVRNIFAARREQWIKVPPSTPDPFQHFTLPNPDYQSFFDEINEVLKQKYTGDDFNYEGNYHVYLSSFFDRRSGWFFKSNYPSGYGRYDFTTWSENQAVDVGYLFEVAHVKGSMTDDSVNARNIQNMIEQKRKQVLKNEYYITIPKRVKICVIVVGWRKRMYFSIYEIQGV